MIAIYLLLYAKSIFQEHMGKIKFIFSMQYMIYSLTINDWALGKSAVEYQSSDCRAGAGLSSGSSGMGRSLAITARMSSGSKPFPRVDACRRVYLSCPGTRNENALPRSCFTAKPASSMSRRKAVKSAGPMPDRRDKQTRPPAFFRIVPVGKPFLHRLNSRFSRRYFVGPDVSCSRGSTSLSRKRAAVFQLLYNIEDYITSIQLSPIPTNQIFIYCKIRKQIIFYFF